MKKLKEYFNDKTGEQIFVLCLLITCVAVMLLCLIARLCGVLWFAADLEAIKEPNKFWQEVIKGALLVFELIFVYKILCRASWLICFIIAICHTIIAYFIPTLLWTNIFHILAMLIIPLIICRKWKIIFDFIILYLITTIYGIIFLIGRIGNIENANANFIYSVLGVIDYKFFIVSFYLVIKYFGGIKIWKINLFQTDLKTKKKA